MYYWIRMILDDFKNSWYCVFSHSNYSTEVCVIIII